MCSLADTTETVTSPNGRVRLEVSVGEHLLMNVMHDDELILEKCSLSLQVDKERFGRNPKLSRRTRTAIDEVVRPVVPLKFASVPNKANQLILTFKGGIGLQLRAYDNGVAYRFILTRGKGKADVVDEGLDLRLHGAYTAHVSKTSGFGTSYENPYSHLLANEMKEGDEMTYLPILLESDRGTKVLFSESILTSLTTWYCALLSGNSSSSLT